MWNQILLLSMLQFLYISAKSIDTIEGPLWLERLSEMEQTDDDLGNAKGTHNDLAYDNLRANDISMKEKRTFLSSLKSSSEKRALSMLARWGSINTVGKERNPIRSGYPPKSFDSISAQTRSRILGQPLRWG